MASEENPAKRARASPTTLWSYWRSSCSWRVRVALALKGVEYGYEAVHLVRDGGEQLAAGYTERNPSQEVPTLEIDGLTLRQSPAILEYLEETRPEPALLPGDAAQRARIREICELIGSGIQAVQNLRVLRKVMAREEGDEAKTAAKLAWGKHWIARGFVALEATLAGTAGEFCVGDAVTMADLFLVPQVYNATRFGVDMDQFPVIKRINERCMAEPAFQAAAPDAQPDAVKA